MDYCFVRGTYRYYGQHFDKVKDRVVKPENYVSYYQVLVFAEYFDLRITVDPFAVSFPNVLLLITTGILDSLSKLVLYVGRFLCMSSLPDIDLETIVNEAFEIESKPKDREEKEEKIAEYIFMYFYNRRASKVTNI